LKLRDGAVVVNRKTERGAGNRETYSDNRASRSDDARE